MHQLSRLPARAAALALMLALAACAAPPPAGYRAPDKKIYSAAVFSPERFAGDWHEVAGLYDPSKTSCALGLTHAAVTKGELTLTLSDCAGPAVTVPATRLAAARFAPALKGARGEAWWVLWVDQDYRTAVIGTPSGKWGAILNRTPGIPADRMEAARQILDFNGYDISRLRPR